jgi:hypothetical protein
MYLTIENVTNIDSLKLVRYYQNQSWFYGHGEKTTLKNNAGNA